MTSPLLLEHFDELISTPDDVEKLKRSILQLAMQGKLVSQDSKDETADALLNKIPQEKRITLSPVAEKEKTFDIPSNWKWIRLEEIAEILMGQSPPGTSYNETGEGVPLINGPVEFGDGAFAKTRKTKFTTAPTKMCKEGDLLVCVRGSTTGRTNISGFDACIGRGVAAIRSRYDYQGFLNYFMLYYRDSFYNLGTGSTFPSVSSDKIQTIPVPLPPLPEQQRIVARVEELFAQTRLLAEELASARTELDRLNESALARLLASETLEEFNERWGFIAEHFNLLTSAPEHIAPLRQSILELAVRGKLTRREAGDESAKELLKAIQEEKEKLVEEKKIRKEPPSMPIKEDDKPHDLPKGWEWARMSDLCYQITDGTHHTPKYLYDGIPFLSVKDVSSGYLDFSNTKFISQEEHEQLIARCKPEFGDVLLTKVGTTGIAVVVDTEKEFSIFVSIALLKFFQDKISPQYLALLINSPFVKRQSDKYTMGVGNKNLVLKYIKNFLTPLPPLAEQERIVKRVEQLLGWCDALEARLMSAEDVRERLVESVLALSEVEGLAGAGGQDGE